MNYEPLTEKTKIYEPTMPLINDLDYQCDYLGNNGQECGNQATNEWQYIDEEDYKAGESFLYVSYRCDEHDIEEMDWNMVD